MSNRGHRLDLVGCVFTRLTVVARAPSASNGHSRWTCKCECGNTTVVQGSNLKSGNVRSCGCLARDVSRAICTIHGEYGTRLNRIWHGLVNRCTNKSNRDYSNYGARGITICEEWLVYKPFADWAKANGYASGLSIDRIDNNKGYSPDNCRWTDQTTQNRNRRSVHNLTFKGKTQPISAWAEETGIPVYVLYDRISKYHFTPERALTQPVRKLQKKEHTNE